MGCIHSQTTEPDFRQNAFAGRMCHELFIVGEHRQLQRCAVAEAVASRRTNNQQRRFVLVRGVAFAENAERKCLVESVYNPTQ